MKFKHNVWHVTGYSGFSNYDGPADNNMDYYISVSDNVSEEQVTDMILAKYKKVRTVVFRVQKVESVE